MLAPSHEKPHPAVAPGTHERPGPRGSLPVTPEMLLTRPSGDLFGWTQNAGMGWDPAAMGGKEILILSTHGGIRAADGTPIALGYHTGHWEVGLLMDAAAKELTSARKDAESSKQQLENRKIIERSPCGPASSARTRRTPRSQGWSLNLPFGSSTL